MCQEGDLLPSQTKNNSCHNGPHEPAPQANESPSAAEQRNAKSSFAYKVGEVRFEPALCPQPVSQSTVFLRCLAWTVRIIIKNLANVEGRQPSMNTRPVKCGKLVSGVHTKEREYDRPAWMSWREARDIIHSPIDYNPGIIRRPVLFHLCPAPHSLPICLRGCSGRHDRLWLQFEQHLREADSSNARRCTKQSARENGATGVS
mmetsp:Transcript_1808/g.4419  ORF Transcript_1808/g.4419 Transcript_1808/m.4419 type:complete len:203 (+) Transcript_1808:924-1532(+)